MASHGRAPMVVTHEGGVKFAAQVGAHRVIVDQPVRGGGEDAGPTPLALLGVGLGTCVALYVQQFCAARNLPYEGFRVEVESRGAQNPGRIGEYIVHVFMPQELPPKYAEMLEQVARSCPAHNTLVHGAAVNVQITAPAPVS